MVNPVLIGVAIVVFLVLVIFLKHILRVVFIFVLIGLVLFVMIPKECGYDIGDNLKECKCFGYSKGEPVKICYGFCRDCECSGVDSISGNKSIVDCIG